MHVLAATLYCLSEAPSDSFPESDCCRDLSESTSGSIIHDLGFNGPAAHFQTWLPRPGAPPPLASVPPEEHHPWTLPWAAALPWI